VRSIMWSCGHVAVSFCTIALLGAQWTCSSELLHNRSARGTARTLGCSSVQARLSRVRVFFSPFVCFGRGKSEGMMTDHSQIYVYVSRVRDHSHICVYVSRGQPSRRYNQVTARRGTPEVTGSHQVQHVSGAGAPVVHCNTNQWRPLCQTQRFWHSRRLGINLQNHATL
jgi:hypothetical protein